MTVPQHTDLLALLLPCMPGIIVYIICSSNTACLPSEKKYQICNRISIDVSTSKMTCLWKEASFFSAHYSCLFSYVKLLLRLSLKTPFIKILSPKYFTISYCFFIHGNSHHLHTLHIYIGVNFCLFLTRYQMQEIKESNLKYMFTQ